MRIVLIIIQLLLGVVFIYWGYLGLINMEDMEYRFVEQHIGNWYLAPVFARLTIGLEWMLGGFMILNIKPKSIFPTMLFLLISLHIFDLVWDVRSNVIVDNYTSFGESTNLFVFLIIAIVFGLYLIIKREYSDFVFGWVKYPLIILSIVLPFILNAIFPQDLNDQTFVYNEPFRSELINSEYLSKLAGSEGLVCFYSTSCPYCVKSAKKIAVAQKRYLDFPPIFICFQGTEEGAAYFLEIANVDANYEVLDLPLYQKFSSLIYPQFQFIEDGRVIKKWDGQSFNYSVMHTLSNNLEFSFIER